jgi:flagellar biosynthesis protein FlhA
MDCAAKFIKGDAIVVIVTQLINIVRGINICMVKGGGDIGTVVNTYNVATWGDGLFRQNPGAPHLHRHRMVGTRAASVNSFSDDLKSQIISYPIRAEDRCGVQITMSHDPRLSGGRAAGGGGGLIATALIPAAPPSAEPEPETSAAPPVNDTESTATPKHYSLLNVSPSSGGGLHLIPLVTSPGRQLHNAS